MPSKRHGVLQRGAAKHLVRLHLRFLEAWFTGTMRALARAGVFGAKVTGIVDATDLETTAAYEGWAG